MFGLLSSGRHESQHCYILPHSASTAVVKGKHLGLSKLFKSLGNTLSLVVQPYCDHALDFTIFSLFGSGNFLLVLRIALHQSKYLITARLNCFDLDRMNSN